MLSVQRVAQAAVIELMAHRSLRRLATLLSVTALQEVIRMMSSSRAAPHQGSGCVTPPTQEAEYMAATVFPSASDHTALAFGLGPYMTAKPLRGVIGIPCRKPVIFKMTHYGLVLFDLGPSLDVIAEK